MSAARRLLAAVVVALVPAAVVAAPTGLRGVGVDEPLAEPPAFAAVLGGISGIRANLPLFVRIGVERARLEPAPGSFELGELNERVAVYYRLGVRVMVDLGAVPQDAAAAEAWKLFVRTLAARFKGRVRAYQLSVSPTAGAPEQAFLVQVAAVEMRAADPETLVVVSGLASAAPEWRADFYGESLAPYVDALAASSGAPGAEATLAELVARQGSKAALVVEERQLADDPREAVDQLLRDEFSALGGSTSLVTYRGSPATLAAIVRATDALADALFDEVVPLDPATTALRIEPADAAVETRLFYDTNRFATYLVYWSREGAQGELSLSLNEASGRKPAVRDAAALRVLPVESFVYSASENRASLRVPLSPTPLLVDFGYGATEARATRVEVTGRVLPPVGEIIFRHQQVQAAQDAVVQHYSADMRIEQHIRPTLTYTSFDVVTENTFFWARDAVEWEERTFSLNGTKWGKDRPPIPLIQPEKVNSLPLDLKLNADYRYRLEGLGSEAGRECYVVAFDPVDASKPLYKGSVWIDSQSFVRLKLRAVQTQPGAPVLSNEETHTFTQVGATSGRPVFLLSRLVGRQLILLAGRNLLLERVVSWDGFKIDAADFEARRAATRKSEAVMYRDTDLGLRHLVRKGGERVVSDRTTKSALALMAGTLIDPSYDTPLPIIGLNYLNFEFPGKKGQTAIVFAGVLALVNLQWPQILGPHVDMSFDLFAIAVRSKDKLFGEQGAESTAELETRPFSAGVNLGYQFTEFQKLTGNYQFRYDSFRATKSTGESFVVPQSTSTNAFSLGYEYRRGGYSLQGSATWNRRSSWKGWGDPADANPARREYLRYQGGLTKEFYKGLHQFRLNLSYFGGSDLDRFSMYQFGMFDETRIHGVPASGVRFPELAMFRGSYSFNLLEMYKLDLFVDQAMGRAPDPSTRWHGITGLGLGFNVHGPFRTLVRGEVGKSFLPKSYAGAGSWNLQIQIFRPL